MPISGCRVPGDGLQSRAVTADPSETLVLLKRWHAGETKALEELLRRHLAWIRTKVHARLGPMLRTQVETDDVVQEAMIQALRYGPRFLLSDEDQFRKLLARIVENVIRMWARHQLRERRDPRRERAPGSETVLVLDSSSHRPSRVAMRNEAEAWLQLGLQLLDPEEREVIVLRQWQGLSFGDTGQKLGIAEDAARMRFQRALARLAQVVKRIQQGHLGQVLAEHEPAG